MLPASSSQTLREVPGTRYRGAAPPYQQLLKDLHVRRGARCTHECLSARPVGRPVAPKITDNNPRSRVLCSHFQNDLLNQNTVTVEIKVDPPAEDDANANNAAVSGEDLLTYKLLGGV